LVLTGWQLDCKTS